MKLATAAIAVLAVLALGAGRVEAQEPIPITVIDSDGTPKAVHSMLVTALRDEIARSPRYTLDPAAARAVELVSLESDNDGGEHSVATTYAVIVRRDGLDVLATFGVMDTGRNSVETAARGLLAKVDRSQEKTRLW